MDADVDVGPVIYYEYGAITENGGTSLASPLSMGTFTRLQSRHNNQLGFAAPNLYASYVAAGGAFGTLAVPTPPAITNSIGGMHDIAYGANGIYAAMPGFDFNTGMGSFDISNLIIAFGG
jgi:subtilase family serine protease